MTDIAAATTPTVADIAKWYKMQEELAALKVAESLLRRRLFDHYFPTPVEGSAHNKVPLNTIDPNDTTGAVLQADHKINRTVLEPELDAYKAALKEEGSNLPKLPINRLIKYKPELSKSEYNKLTEEERAACDTFLNIKPGSPELKVVIPKRGA
jgi:hypothetical protein